jgi:hypothetical protein
MKLVIIESPYAGDTETNLVYARLCMSDSLMRGEAPLASHLLYTQERVLNDKIPDERSLGINAGYAWGEHAELAAVYYDLGTSPGMMKAIQYYELRGTPVEYRILRSPQLEDFLNA